MSADPGPWTPAPDSLWRNNDLDPRRFAAREALVRAEATEHRRAEAVQFGRIQGLGSQHYDMIRQKKLEGVLARQKVTDKVW